VFDGKRFIAIIPARGGSVGIKYKNLQKVDGVSLVGRSIVHASRSKHLDDYYVSTNDTEIMNESSKFDSKVIHRPEEISLSTSPTEDCLIHACQVLNLSTEDYIVLLQPTSPFRDKNLIDACIEQVATEKTDTLVACYKFHDFCFFKYIVNGKWESTFDFRNRPMRQSLNLESWKFFDAGCVYITKVDVLLKDKCRLNNNMSVREISCIESFQIDEQVDLDIAERMKFEE